jgi:uncharacterized protein YjbJ (UPF0337 family)
MKKEQVSGKVDQAAGKVKQSIRKRLAVRN